MAALTDDLRRRCGNIGASMCPVLRLRADCRQEAEIAAWRATESYDEAKSSMSLLGWACFNARQAVWEFMREELGRKGTREMRGRSEWRRRASRAVLCPTSLENVPIAESIISALIVESPDADKRLDDAQKVRAILAGCFPRERALLEEMLRTGDKAATCGWRIGMSRTEGATNTLARIRRRERALAV